MNLIRLGKRVINLDQVLFAEHCAPDLTLFFPAFDQSLQSIIQLTDEEAKLVWNHFVILTPDNRRL